MAVVAPVTVMPVMTVPAVVVPVMVMPAYLHRLHLIDFVLRDDRRFNGHRRRARRLARDRRHGSRLCAGGKQNRARNQSSAEIQETRKLHDVCPFHEEREYMQSRRLKMNVR